MTTEKVIEGLKKLKSFHNGSYGDACNEAIDIIEKESADGCKDCAFETVEEWEMPCRKCKRACKDYWRAKG